tara:strand:- start:3256 stop:3999 length:744 start_codon:yes stop_codon:yes gene_type:complete
MSEFILQIEQLLSAYGDPEYRFLLLEPLIFYGILAGVFMLSIGYFMKAPKLQIAALIVVGIAALAHVPYKDARLSAQPRMEQVYKISSPARMKGFNENTQQWIANSWKFRLLILAATVTIMIGINRNRIGYGLGIATIILGLMAAKNAMWLHYKDAVAYHPNLQKHEAPIDQRRKESASHVSTTPPRSANRSPAPAGSTSVSPGSLTQPLSIPSSQPSYNSYQNVRIPPPEVPVLGPRQRPVTPLSR